MIVPRPRLLIYVALFALPAATLAGVVPALLWPCLGLIAVLSLIVLLDALAAGAGTESLQATLPAKVSLSMQTPASLLLTLMKDDLKSLSLRAGLRLAKSLEPETDIQEAAFARGDNALTLAWPLKPSSRGDYFLKEVYLGLISPLGFWSRHRTLALSCHIAVYPNLQADRKQLAALFLHRGPVGLHSQRQIGQGREVEKLREYIPGDGFDTVHWKATARRGQPITKIYQVERTQDIYAVVDISRLSARRAPGGNDAIVERYLNAALLLGLAVQNQGDRFGLIAFSNKINRFLPAGLGAAHSNACREALYNVRVAKVSPDFDELTTFIRTRLRRRALLVFLTNLDDPLLGEHFLQCVNILKRKHLVFAPLLEQKGVRPFFDHDPVETSSALYSALGSHMIWEKELELQTSLRVAGIQTATVQSDQLCAQMVSHYLNIKRRQLL